MKSNIAHTCIFFVSLSSVKQVVQAGCKFVKPTRHFYEEKSLAAAQDASWRLRGGRSAYFFSAQFFFCMPSSFHPFLCLRNLFTELYLLFFQSSCIESLSLRCFRPSRPWERPHVRARRSSFSPRRPRKAERAFRVRIGRNVRLWLKVEDTQRAKRFCFRVSKSQLSFSCVFGSCVFVV